MRTRRKVLAIAFVATVGAWPTGTAEAINFSDSTFLNSDWSAGKTFDSSPGQNGAFSVGQVTTGGNPGAFRQTQLDVTGPGGFIVSHLRSGAIYDPTIGGAIATIDFSLDVKFISGSAGTSQTLYELDLMQNGVHYLSNATAALAQGPGNGAAGSWQAFSFSGLTASDFVKFTGSGNPDFSATGGAIQFGFLNTVSEAFGNPLSVTSGIDNWSVTANPAPVPEPATVLLLGSGLAGLGGAAWRRYPRKQSPPTQ